MNFLGHAEVLTSQEIYLLGDIFDFMMGEHKEYLELYPDFFNSLKRLIEKGKVIHFFEGNHDFHLKGLFEKYFFSPNFLYHRKGFFKKIGEKNIYFEHGDDIQIGDPSYKVLKFILRNPFSRFLFNKIFPFKVQQSVAEYFSNKSRKRGQEYYSNQDDIKKIFRKSALKFWEKNKIDYIVAGHSHCQDLFITPEGKKYINNGYPSQSGSFIVIDGINIQFYNFNENVLL